MIKKIYYNMATNLRDMCQQWSSLPEKNPVLVYSMRKVASTSLTKTLRNNGISAHKLHLLNPELIREFQRAFHAAGGTEDHSIVEGMRFRRRLERWRRGGSSRGRLKIFTFVRDPVAIAASDFFMQLNDFLPDVFKDRQLGSAERLAAYFSEVMKSVVGDAPRDPVVFYLAKICALPMVWFDEELKLLTGIDVYRAKFHSEKGAAHYHAQDADIALIRTDMLSEVGLYAINACLGANICELATSNVRSDSPSGRLYKEFLQHVQLQEDLVRTIYARARIEHFYTEVEIDEWVDRWTLGSDRPNGTASTMGTTRR